MRAAFTSWRARAAPREQALVALAALLVVGALAWRFLIVPLNVDLAATEDRLTRARLDLAQARAQAGELAQSRNAPTSPGDARAAVERLLAQQSLRGALTAIAAKDGRVELTFEAIDFAALTLLVDALGQDTKLFPVEALIAARTTPGSVRAELTLARPTAR